MSVQHYLFDDDVADEEAQDADEDMPDEAAIDAQSVAGDDESDAISPALFL